MAHQRLCGTHTGVDDAELVDNDDAELGVYTATGWFTRTEGRCVAASRFVNNGCRNRRDPVGGVAARAPSYKCVVAVVP